MSDGHNNAGDVRLGKLEAALRENLRRRKAQARARKAQGKEEELKGATKGSLSSPDLAKEPD